MQGGHSPRRLVTRPEPGNVDLGAATSGRYRRQQPTKQHSQVEPGNETPRHENETSALAVRYAALTHPTDFSP